MHQLGLYLPIKKTSQQLPKDIEKKTRTAAHGALKAYSIINLLPTPYLQNPAIDKASILDSVPPATITSESPN